MYVYIYIYREREREIQTSSNFCFQSSFKAMACEDTRRQNRKPPTQTPDIQQIGVSNMLQLIQYLSKLLAAAMACADIRGKESDHDNDNNNDDDDDDDDDDNDNDSDNDNDNDNDNDINIQVSN